MCNQSIAGLAATTTSVVQASNDNHAKVQQNARLRQALPLRSLLLLAACVGPFCRCCRLGNRGELQGAPPAEAVSEQKLSQSRRRDYLKAGSIYQNDYMTLWNAKKTPISVTLRVNNGDAFELRIEHLNSAGGGSEGWLAIQGHFHMEPMPGAPGRSALVPEANGGEKPFAFDATLFDSTTAFALRCLQRLSGAALLSALELEVDTAHDAVMVNPRSASLRMLWSKAVILRLTPEEDLWEPDPEPRASGDAVLV